MIDCKLLVRSMAAVAAVIAAAGLVTVAGVGAGVHYGRKRRLSIGSEPQDIFTSRHMDAACRIAQTLRKASTWNSLTGWSEVYLFATDAVVSLAGKKVVVRCLGHDIPGKGGVSTAVVSEDNTFAMALRDALSIVLDGQLDHLKCGRAIRADEPDEGLKALSHHVGLPLDDTVYPVRPVAGPGESKFFTQAEAKPRGWKTYDFPIIERKDREDMLAGALWHMWHIMFMCDVGTFGARGLWWITIWRQDVCWVACWDRKKKSVKMDLRGAGHGRWTLDLPKFDFKQTERIPAIRQLLDNLGTPQLRRLNGGRLMPTIDMPSEKVTWWDCFKYFHKTNFLPLNETVVSQGPDWEQQMQENAVRCIVKQVNKTMGHLPRPVVKPVLRPVVKPVLRPVVKPVPRPVVKPVPRPAVRSVPMPAVKPVPLRVSPVMPQAARYLLPRHGLDVEKLVQDACRRALRKQPL